MNLKRRTPHLIEFDSQLPSLSENEQEVLKLLTEAAELVVPIYQLQENSAQPGANFYPSDASKEEIEQAATNDPQIMSPYTIVERVDGKLIATPYHQKYAELLRPISEKLMEASQKTEDPTLASNLQALSTALLEGKYDEAAENRIKSERTKLDIGIGPLEKHDDQLFFVKTSYEAWVGVLDEERTDVLSLYQATALSVKRQALAERVENGKVRPMVERAVLLVGQLAKTAFVGFNYPASLSVIEKYGSEFLIFKEANELRLDEQIIPTYDRIFSEEFRKSFTTEDIRKGNWRYVTMHEMAHTYLRYKNAAKNLQDLYPTIEELAANALGFRMAGSLLLKDVLTIQDLAAMIIAFLCKSNFLKSNIEEQQNLMNYMVGGKVFVNYLIKSGAIRKLDEITVPNFAKIFVSIQELSGILEKILSDGTRQDAEAFIKEYSSI